MCKIIIIPNASKVLDFDHFSKFMAEIMSDMSDGYGYAAKGIDGVFGYRTLLPLDYATGLDIPAFCVNPSELYGKISQVNGPAIFHGRISTNKVDLLNTHPIVRDSWHLIHNGVVTNHGEKYAMLTSNDSEHVLYNLINGGIDAMGKNLTGYYAGAAIDPTGLLHIFRDSIATLYYAYSHILDSPIFATNSELIEEIGIYLGEELSAIAVKDNQYLVYDEGKLIKHLEFTSRGYDKHSAKLASKSLGYELENNEPVNVYGKEYRSYRDYLESNDNDEREGSTDEVLEKWYREANSDDSPQDIEDSWANNRWSKQWGKLKKVG